MPPVTQTNELGTPGASQQTVADVVSTPQSPQLDTMVTTPVIDVNNLNTQPIQVEQPRDVLQEQIDELITTDITDQQSESQQRDLFNRFLGISTELQGEEAARQELQTKFDVFGLEQQINEYTAEAARLQNQLRAGELRRRQEGGLGTFIRSDINEARQQVAIELQGLQASAALAQGNLLTAEKRINSALRAKYEPLRVASNAILQAFQLNESIMTRSEKKAADKLKMELEQLKSQQDYEEQVERDAFNTLFTARDNGGDPIAIADMMRKVQSGDAGLPEVMQQFGEFLQDPVKRAELTLKNIQIQNEYNARRAAEIAQENGILDEKQLDVALDIRKQVIGEQAYKNMQTIESSLASIITAGNRAVQENSGAADISLVNSFQRLIDPGAVVREGDVTLLQTAQSLYEQAQVRANRIGGSAAKFTDEFRNELMSTAEQLYEAQRLAYGDKIDPFKRNAEQRGIDFNTYIAKDFKSVEDIKGSLPEVSPETTATSVLDGIAGPQQVTPQYISPLEDLFNQIF